MAIVLTQYEKHSLFRFLGIYLISSITLIGIIAFLVFWIQKEQLYQSIRNQMLLKSSQIAQMVIFDHMSGKAIFDPKILLPLQDEEMQITLFQKDKTPLFGKDPFPKNKEKFSISNHKATLLDNGAYGHLGIEWILICVDFKKQFHSLIFYIVLASILCFIFISIFGLILGKLFLKPVRDGISFLDCFIKDITHELNTPISAIIMSVGSLKNEINHPKISRIYKACKRIEFLYNNLTFLFLGEVSQIKEQIEFLDLLKNRLEMFEEHIKEKQISLTILKQERVYFFGDKEGITRMIDNLLSNAIKYSQNGGKIFLSLSAQKFCIQNSGNPISSDLIKKIKQRYFRANLKTQGYGIGLDIIQKVAYFHHWVFDISYQDSLNTFTIFFDSTLTPH